MFSRRKILVVEDNELNRKMLCDILSPVYDVLEAENGQKALDILKEYGEGLSLILLDIVMPVMDGYTFLSVMKADSAYSSIPVIVTTQNDGEADEIAALSYGASDFVAKPYRPLIILHRVASIINLRETASMMNMMQYDRLSGLYSKEFFYQKVKTILMSNPGIQYDIVCSDIENFKLINDVFGVSTGDKLLCTVAEVYKESREYNGICGRLNADRFACLVERRRNYTNTIFQEKIEKISKKMELSSIVMKWGIYTIENYTVPVDQMCDRALLAAQSIKGQYGKYFAEYDDKLRDLLLKEQAITDSMESALQQNQFKVYLQPKYRIKDGIMVGAEALVRWNHPKWGIQSPAKFIPLFEKNGFITKLDQFVWEKACVFMREWDDKGYTPISVSVNVSRADIYNADITDILTGIIQKYGLPPSRLHLEITESAYTENPKQIIDTVAHLRELGFIIEMDDFGTGYSSLNMLNEMPIDLLKLDMKFIQNETAKSDSKGILQFIINLARWMNLGVVAEGVETEEQLTFLSENGCDYVQGYYFSKPLPRDEFETLLADLGCAEAVSGLDHIMSHLESPHNEPERKDVPPSIEDRQKYNEMLMQHYRTPEPNTLIIGYYSITHNRIREIIDHTGSDILNTFGTVRENFITGLSSFIVEEEQRQKFLDIYLNTSALTAFKRKDTEQILKCFVKFPADERGRYVQFKVNLVEAPDAEDITGILTVIDITEQVITDKILHQLSVTNYDFVVDLNLDTDFYTVLAHNTNGNCMPGPQGSHLKRIEEMMNSVIVPRDREVYEKSLDPAEIRLRLKKEKSYTFAYSITNENGDIRTKNMTVSAVDLRIGRVCMVRTDITDSIREQRGLLNMIAYTFELAGFINVKRELLTLYTRRTILDNLSPQVMNYCENAVEGFSDIYIDTKKGEETYEQFFLENMLRRLKDKPEGYDFLLSQQMGNGLRYKQINVLWGDSDHSTICFVQADVTDILSAERDTKAALEEALSLAEEANRTKSEFLSAMSHDIRTPMNAIMGMTVLASAHIEDRERVADCLEKISISSKHLLSLINDVLDMSKIERSQITLSNTKIILSALLDQVLSIIASQAQGAGIEFIIRKKHIQNDWFYGDALRINQILINVLSNAIKFTPEGGSVEFHVEEIPALKHGNVRYCFVVKDTGVGIPEEFLTYLFEPFTRSYRAYRVEGTGLGLSITKGLVDLMGGIISVESTVSQGTEFRIELEYESAAENAGNTIENKRLSFSDLEVRKLFADRCFLVAEDNEINAEILCELLSLYGAESVVVTDGAQAVSAFENAPKNIYDAILMDIQMPEMNGYQAARVIRKMDREDAESIPIVAMTANAFAEDIREALDAGMNAHVAKPIDIEMLQVTLSKLL